MSSISSRLTIETDPNNKPKIPWHFWVSVRNPIQYIQWRIRQNKKLRAPAPYGYCCPNCNGLLFYPGPSGCGSANVKCANPDCGKKYCYGGFFIQPIDNEDRYYGGQARCLFTM